MMKYLILVAFLLATANAFPFHVYKRDEQFYRLYKRAPTFTACKTGSPTPLIVTYDADPIIGKASNATTVFIAKEQHATMFLTTMVIDNSGQPVAGGVKTADLCDTDTGIKCPIESGKQVTVNSTVLIPKSANLPYSIEHVVHNETTVIGCSSAAITFDGAGGAGGDAGGKGTPAGAPTGDGGTPAGAPTGDGGTPAGAPTGDGGTPAGAPTGDGGTPAGAPTGDGGTPAGAPKGDGGTPAGTPTGDTGGTPEPDGGGGGGTGGKGTPAGAPTGGGPAGPTPDDGGQ